MHAPSDMTADVTADVTADSPEAVDTRAVDARTDMQYVIVKLNLRGAKSGDAVLPYSSPTAQYVDVASHSPAGDEERSPEGSQTPPPPRYKCLVCGAQRGYFMTLPTGFDAIVRACENDQELLVCSRDCARSCLRSRESADPPPPPGWVANVSFWINSGMLDSAARLWSC